jgi:hypothetical protein
MPDPSIEKTKPVETVQFPTGPTTSLIFVSHDSRDAELAEAFCKLLSVVSCGVLKSFRSSDRKGSQGIEYGVEWYPELMKKLSVASDVVCLLTQRSLDRPWILYEAGVAKGKLNTPVFGIALGIPLNRVSSGPFAQFENCDDEEESLTKLVIQLVGRIPYSEPDHDAIVMQVKEFKQKATKILKTLTDSKDKKEEKPVVDETSAAKLFEEIKIMFKDLPSRVEGKLTDAIDPIRRRRFRRFNPMMFDDLMRMSETSRDPIGILLITSLFREDFPWIYELGNEVYKAIKSGDRAEIERTILTLRRTAEMLMHGPMMEEFGMGGKESFMAFDMLMMTLERLAKTFVPSEKKPGRKEK